MSELWHDEEYTSYGILVLGAIGYFFILASVYITGSFVFYWVIAFLLTMFLILFYSIRVRCDHDDVFLTFGLGFIESQIPLHSVQHAGPVPNETLMSFAYNPTGSGAVCLELRNGKRYTFPASKPKELAETLMQRVMKR